MPVKINGETYYRTAEVYRLLGISRNTLYHWLRQGALGGTERRDRHGWRLFTEEEVERLKGENGRITVINRPRSI